MPDPSSLLIAFFELPRWAQPTLILMAAGLVVMNAVLGAALRSRRKALLKLEEVTRELGETKAKLASELRWRNAEEQYLSDVSGAKTALTVSNRA